MTAPLDNARKIPFNVSAARFRAGMGGEQKLQLGERKPGPGSYNVSLQLAREEERADAKTIGRGPEQFSMAVQGFQEVQYSAWQYSGRISGDLLVWRCREGEGVSGGTVSITLWGG